MLNFYHWCKTPSSAFSKKNFSDDPHFLHVFGRAPSDLQLCFVQWKLSHRLRDIRLLSIPWPWNPGYGSLKVIENYTTRSGTHDFLLTFHSHRFISHRFRDIGHFRWKSSFFLPPVYITPDEGFPLEFGIGVRGPKCLNDGLPDGRKSFKTDLVVLIQYRLWQTPTHPASQTRYRS